MIEVIIAIAILSVGLLGAIRVFPIGLRASQRAELVSRATLAGERTIETIKMRGWDDLADGESTTEEGEFAMRVVVDQPAVDGLIDAADLKRVSVMVGWTQEGRQRSLTLVTYVHRPAA